MGNTNQGGPSGALMPGERAKHRRPSTSDPAGPLEFESPMGTNRYNETTPPSSQAKFGKNLLEQEELIKQVKKDTIPAVIKWTKEGREVFVAGSFNNWEKKIPLVRSEKNFYTIVELPEGEHEYKFYIDGQWRHNPDEPAVKNNTGTLNNVMKVAPADFEILEALETDNAATSTTKKSQLISGRPPSDATEDSQAEEYGRDIPVRKPTDKHTGPPILPPQLLQVILNKDVAEHLEPGMLPEPNHVMLNHLYALSIKDGVMVLSDTSRYRKKYVTTLLYKPID